MDSEIILEDIKLVTTSGMPSMPKYDISTPKRALMAIEYNRHRYAGAS